MADVSVYEYPIEWTILPPSIVKKESVFTVVAQFNGIVDPQVYEACMLDKLSGVSERFLGNCCEAGPRFNNNGKRVTYVWFNILAREQGNVELKFRLTWRRGHRLYGGLETFDVEIRKDTEPTQYRTDEQDLLALLEPSHYDPTPVDEMNQRA
ncbi:hypothetical protein F5B21DRAFT_484702 [Xylaria acuta]|nr:hypothetical protein F5B21DRAFT_484702 [Xylaria acuta]